MNEIKGKKYSKLCKKKPSESSRMSMKNPRHGCDIVVTPSKAN